MQERSLHNEKELLLQIAGGNEQAFRTIYDAYFNRLAAYVFKLCKSENIAEEVVQEVFMKLWLKRPELKKITHPEAYIFSIARNKTIDYLRAIAKDSNLIVMLSVQVQQSHEADKKLGEKELHQLINAALQQLSEQKKTIFHLSRNMGLSHDEIAHRLQLSKSTVKNHLSETLRHIKTHIDNQHNTELLTLLILLQLQQ